MRIRVTARHLTSYAKMLWFPGVDPRGTGRRRGPPLCPSRGSSSEQPLDEGRAASWNDWLVVKLYIVKGQDGSIGSASVTRSLPGGRDGDLVATGLGYRLKKTGTEQLLQIDRWEFLMIGWLISRESWIEKRFNYRGYISSDCNGTQFYYTRIFAR